MSKSLYSGVNKVYSRSYLLLNIVASSAYILVKQQKFKKINIKEEISLVDFAPGRFFSEIYLSWTLVENLQM